MAKSRMKLFFFFKSSLNEVSSADETTWHEAGLFLFIKYCCVLIFMSTRFGIFCLAL